MVTLSNEAGRDEECKEVLTGWMFGEKKGTSECEQGKEEQREGG